MVDEAFRIYPPSVASFPRVVPGSGEAVVGRWVPGGTSVGIPQYAANHDPNNFYLPDEFLPERWLAAELHNESDAPFKAFVNDQRDIV